MKKELGRPKGSSPYTGEFPVLTYVSKELKEALVRASADLAIKTGKPMSLAETVRTLLGEQLLGEQRN